jgi:hypothetical protein
MACSTRTNRALQRCRPVISDRRSTQASQGTGEVADVAIGSRWLRAETQIQRQPLHRQLFGRIFNLLLRIILGLQLKDPQCGFKAFKQLAVQAIFPLQKIERWGFDSEILFLARKLGFKALEVPVAWGHSDGTRINPLVDGSRRFIEMLRIRWYDLQGKYDREPAITGRMPRAQTRAGLNRSLRKNSNVHFGSLGSVGNRGAWFATAGEAVRWFQKHRSVLFEADGAGLDARCALRRGWPR